MAVEWLPPLTIVGAPPFDYDIFVIKQGGFIVIKLNRFITGKLQKGHSAPKQRPLAMNNKCQASNFTQTHSVRIVQVIVPIRL